MCWSYRWCYAGVELDLEAELCWSGVMGSRVGVGAGLELSGYWEVVVELVL